MLEFYGQWQTEITVHEKQIKGRLVVLPMPPSENERLVANWEKAREVVAGGYYANFNGKTKRGAVTNSRLYNQWKSASSNLLRKGKLEQLKGDIAVLVIEIFPDNRRRDIDNRVKGLFDAMTQCEHMFSDDSQVSLLTVEKRVMAKKNFVIAFVLPRTELPEMWFNVESAFIKKIADTIPEVD